MDEKGEIDMQIREEQLEQVNQQVRRLIASQNFYGKRLQEAGITEVKDTEDFLRLPFSEKQDLRDAYPLSLMAVPEEKIVRIHSSSGTTGTPKIIIYDGNAISEQILLSGDIVKINPTIKNDKRLNIRLIAFLPFYHIFGLMATFLWFFFFGRTFIFLPKYDS